jgi:predicted MFS family arabinose efflux permease
LKQEFSAFRSRDFRIMWSGACTSSIGTWMQKLAQSWLVLELSGSPFLLGLDAFLGESPVFFFALLAGVAADRIDRRRLLIASQIVQMSCALTLATLFATGHAQVWHILALSFVVGTAQSFGAPAYQALLPSLVPREDLPNAIAMNSIQFNLARILGPVLGALALNSLGAAACFGLNGISYVAVIGSLLSIHPQFLPAKATTTILDSMKDGIHFIRRQPAMESLIVVAFLMTSLGIPIVVFLPVFAKDVFQQGVGTFTLMQVVEGTGAIVGGLLVAARGKSRHIGRDAVLSIIALGALMAAFASSKILLLSCVFLFFAGVALINCFALISSLVQLVATDEMRGRVMSIYNIAFRGGMPIGSLLVGSLIPFFGAPLVVGSAGVVLAGCGLYLLLVHRQISTLE